MGVYFIKCESSHISLSNYFILSNFLFLNLVLWKYGDVVFGFWINSTYLSGDETFCCDCLNETLLDVIGTMKLSWSKPSDNLIHNGICIIYEETWVWYPSGKRLFQIHHAFLQDHCWFY